MAKTQEEIIKLKQEYEELNSKLKELNDDELNQVTGGIDFEQGKFILTRANQEEIFNGNIIGDAKATISDIKGDRVVKDRGVSPK